MMMNMGDDSDDVYNSNDLLYLRSLLVLLWTDLTSFSDLSKGWWQSDNNCYDNKDDKVIKIFLLSIQQSIYLSMHVYHT